MKIEEVSTLKIHNISQEKFEREEAAGNLNPNEIYLTPAPEVDNEPIEGSNNLITSGAVYKAISEITPVIEIQQIDNGHKIILTSVNGTEDFIIQNGVNGAKGDKGDTPIRGTDYYTEADKTEIVNAVIAALPVAEGGNY